MKKNKAIAVVIIGSHCSYDITGLYRSIVGFGPTGTGAAAKNIITGLDLAGGVSITYQASQ